MTTVLELRALLERLFPTFSAVLIDSDFMNENGDFTAHGICTEFTRFYCQHSLDLGQSDKSEFFQIIEEIIASDPEDCNPVANALCTCFLEDMSCTDVGEISRQFMGPASLKFFNYWHVDLRSK